MNQQLIAIAQRCLDGAYDDTVSFPEGVGALIGAGFEGYAVDYRRHTRTYYMPNGDSIVLENPVKDGAVSEKFDKAGIEASIRWAQAKPPEYTYVDFNNKVTGLGCAGYLVSFSGRRVVYYGRTGELHVEHFPQ